MSGDTRKQQKVYTAREAATLLAIQNTTVRKYSQLLEKAGYHIHKNELGHRGFFDKDIMVLRKIRELIKHPDMSLDQAINAVISTVGEDSVSDRDTEELVTYQGTQQYEQLLKQFEDFKEEQMKFNQELLKQIQQRDEYISKKLENRDRELLEAVKGMQETQKLIAASEEKKKKWWEFWK
ncbi:DUF3967 domain-containing protein [Priestia megaterium]|uniref:DUF3967 domain-containing protein n=1 Tax=Priestia megaterium TaxID=1404 RepID=UPI000990815C|nr:DUF3967 domain-containing protein [Priestia megaterium]AQU77210.1 hypothetical protein BUW91_28825 [Priestia megaterium]PGZ76314.1 hypothetical protein COE55_19445 [Priestia megaterium]